MPQLEINCTLRTIEFKDSIPKVKLLYTQPVLVAGIGQITHCRFVDLWKRLSSIEIIKILKEEGFVVLTSLELDMFVAEQLADILPISNMNALGSRFLANGEELVRRYAMYDGVLDKTCALFNEKWEPSSYWFSCKLMD